MNKIGWVLLSLAFATGLAAQPPGGQTGDAGMGQMQQRMHAMQEQMARIHATSDPQERQRLMQEHMQSMSQGMAMMGRMMQQPAAGADADETATRCRGDDTECRMRQMQDRQGRMEQRFGLMQQMMQQMMDHMMSRPGEGAEATPDADAPAPAAPGTDHSAHH